MYRIMHKGGKGEAAIIYEVLRVTRKIVAEYWIFRQPGFHDNYWIERITQ